MRRLSAESWTAPALAKCSSDQGRSVADDALTLRCGVLVLKVHNHFGDAEMTGDP